MKGAPRRCLMRRRQGEDGPQVRRPWREPLRASTEVSMRRTLIAATITAAAFVWASVVTTAQPSDTKAHVMVTPRS